MKIRLTGTLAELSEAAELLPNVFTVLEVSEPYRNRNSELFRLYAEVRLVTDQR